MITVRHTFPIDVDGFWEKLFFSEDFNHRLYVETLGFRRYDIVESSKSENGDQMRKIVAQPKTEAPATLQKIIGDSFSYTETGRFEAATKRYRFRIEPSKLADKFDVSGSFWLEPKGPNQSERVCEVNARVSIFGVGKLFESFIDKTTAEEYDKAAAFTVKYIHNMSRE